MIHLQLQMQRMPKLKDAFWLFRCTPTIEQRSFCTDDEKRKRLSTTVGWYEQSNENEAQLRNKNEAKLYVEYRITVKEQAFEIN